MSDRVTELNLLNKSHVLWGFVPKQDTAWKEFKVMYCTNDTHTHKQSN